MLQFSLIQSRCAGAGSALEKENFDLKLELAHVKFDSERRELGLRIDTLSKDNEALTKDNEALRMELDSAKAHIQKLESKTASVAHKIKKAGTNSKSSKISSQQIKAKALVLRESGHTYQQIAEQLFKEGYKTKNGKPFSSGQISNWLKS
ncbi:hypothetical protein PN36_29050 [Candidatus Thiomargarita nelsonii]|uniref:Recombinase domain-containing protein n=1 Tax=Candidatus Thiomargarita nelsonii TaxID=1003181 RepID=A0A4E0RC51_9GAMM|nr:hypothetical protein PN36_29050 [Candidatus Thiomargarita nelsonii]